LGGLLRHGDPRHRSCKAKTELVRSSVFIASWRLGFSFETELLEVDHESPAK
jgi:hypothetical protein